MVSCTHSAARETARAGSAPAASSAAVARSSSCSGTYPVASSNSAKVSSVCSERSRAQSHPCWGADAAGSVSTTEYDETSSASCGALTSKAVTAVAQQSEYRKERGGGAAATRFTITFRLASERGVTLASADEPATADAEVQPAACAPR